MKIPDVDFEVYLSPAKSASLQCASSTSCRGTSYYSTLVGATYDHTFIQFSYLLSRICHCFEQVEACKPGRVQDFHKYARSNGLKCSLSAFGIFRAIFCQPYPRLGM
eukprot:4198415-Heterocapsa_arctica.AAC.1